MMLNIFSMLQCLYCAPDKTLELISLRKTETHFGIRINHGVIFCNSCQRFYMIKDEILFCSQDQLRDKEDELAFLRTWQDDLPNKVLYSSKPHNITSVT